MRLYSKKLKPITRYRRMMYQALIVGGPMSESKQQFLAMECMKLYPILFDEKGKPRPKAAR